MCLSSSSERSDTLENRDRKEYREMEVPDSSDGRNTVTDTMCWI